MPEPAEPDPIPPPAPDDPRRVAGLPVVVWVVIGFAILVILLAWFGLLPNTPL